MVARGAVANGRADCLPEQGLATGSRCHIPMVADEQQMSLSAWYAEPLDDHQAHRLLTEAQRQQQRAHRQRRSCSACPFHELIARFWLGRSTDALYDHLMHDPRVTRRQALAQLISGQLLMSRRLRGAMERLRNGFFLAAPHLQAAEYFQILKRHELLALLPLLAQPGKPQGLESLLREARVIQQLQGRRGSFPGNRGDTVG